MPWLRIDDRMYCNRKVARASLQAKCLWIWAMDMSADQLTDGELLPSDLQMLAGMLGIADWQTVADELVSVELFERHENGSYTIHDYLDYNPSKEDVMKDREGSVERQAKWRAKNLPNNSPANTRHNTVTNNVSNSVGAEVPYPSPYPFPNNEDNYVAAANATATVKKPPKPQNGKLTANGFNMRALWAAYFSDEPPPETDSARGKANKGFSELDRAGAKPDDMQPAKKNYRRRYPNVDINPMALAAHWHEVKPRAAPRDPTRDELGRDKAFWAEWQEMTYEEQVEHTEDYRQWCKQDSIKLEEFAEWQKLFPLRPAPT